MTDVEKIALWVGLIASIVSIVLSVVAIVFARIVDKSAREVSAQTIKSLQKIESYVERLSSVVSLKFLYND
jgi:mannose/fructose/N-acetylgalactosamine-specific phosphotransferase system component IIC